MKYKILIIKQYKCHKLDYHASIHFAVLCDMLD